MYCYNLFIFYYYINKIGKFSNLKLINHTWNQLCTKKYKKKNCHIINSKEDVSRLEYKSLINNFTSKNARGIEFKLKRLII